MVELRRKRIVDDADQRNEIIDKSKRNTDVGVCVHEIGGSVYGVYDEGWGGGEVETWVVGFFAEESGMVTGGMRLDLV